jgi:exonuclease VII small subunit
MSQPKLDIKEKMAKLDELLAWFTGDDFELEAALDTFSEAKALADSIDADLVAMKNTITVLGEQFDRDSE